jgi:glycosyltransferase involved in cell wall biosynthesis
MRVSVVVITYNHAAFIREALDSVLMQEGCDFELLISEDRSTDGTREIVQEYARKHPERIRVILSEQNIHSNAVVARAMEAARGDFIALLDGDDYWLSPDKLRKQVHFLREHPECALCFHNARARSEGEGREWNWTSLKQKEISTLEDIWQGNFIATCSTMFRAGVLPKIPKWYDGFFPITDWPLHILHAEHGKIGYINEVLGVYRLHRGGLFSPLTERQKLAETLKFYQRMNKCLEYRYDQLVQAVIAKYFIEWVEEYLKRGDIVAAREAFRYYLAGTPINHYVKPKRALRNALRVYAPQRILPRRWRVA